MKKVALLGANGSGKSAFFLCLNGSPEAVFNNSAALETTNRKKPAALRLFQDLTESGILPTGLALSRDLDTLEKYIHATKEIKND